MLIKLTQIIDLETTQELVLNPEFIAQLYPNKDSAILETLGKVKYWVKESPDQITYLIQEAQEKREIKPVKYRVGDVLIFEYPKRLAKSEGMQIAKAVKDTIGCKCIILDDSVKFVGVIGPEYNTNPETDKGFQVVETNSGCQQVALWIGKDLDGEVWAFDKKPIWIRAGEWVCCEDGLNCDEIYRGTFPDLEPGQLIALFAGSVEEDHS